MCCVWLTQQLIQTFSMKIMLFKTNFTYIILITIMNP